LLIRSSFSSLFFSFQSHGDSRVLHSFPTRRSSDLHLDVLTLSRLGGAGQVTTLPDGRVMRGVVRGEYFPGLGEELLTLTGSTLRDRKSTRLNSSHVAISYAVFCLKKKK